MLSLWYGNDFSFSCKENSFPQERLSTWSHFESEGFWNSEAYYITIFFKNVHKTVLIDSQSSTENKPPIFNAYSLIFKSWVSSHYFYFELILTPLHRLLILPLRPRMWNLQSNSQPGNKMSALKYFRDLSTSHPRHLDRVSSSLKCISPKMFFTSKGIGMPSSDCLEFLFATHTYVKKDGLYCEIWHMNIDHSRNSAYKTCFSVTF